MVQKIANNKRVTLNFRTPTNKCVLRHFNYVMMMIIKPEILF